MFNLEEAIEFILEHCQSESEHWGLPTYEIGGNTYAIGDDYDCDKATTEYIKETVCAFTSDFLSHHLVGGNLSPGQIDALRGDSCEDINETFLAMIDDFDDFVADAISADGRGSFLSPYDGEEHECGDYFIYQID